MHVTDILTKVIDKNPQTLDKSFNGQLKVYDTGEAVTMTIMHLGFSAPK